jgi:hypothetical protein
MHAIDAANVARPDPAAPERVGSRCHVVPVPRSYRRASGHLQSGHWPYWRQRLQLGDVVLIDLPGQETKIEAQVVGYSPEATREIERSDHTVRATLQCAPRCGSQVETTS